MSAVTLDTAISALTVSGLTIKGLSAIPQEVNARDCPLLFPDPSKWLGQGASTPGNFDNVSAGRVQYEHNCSYILAYAQDGSGRGLSDYFSGMAALVFLLTQALIRIDIVAMSIRRVSVTGFGQMTDPTGKGFYGCGITVTALEYIPGV
jgi:hypothetical protein